ncbi:membrane-flanked domain-containing protein [Rhodopirellula maiorica SM1]|uniref:Membrane-flanked domain-containing protein n=1 Tax=Rhodopirellula maiorica SM1 TaxID=1265738 RepID=M5RU07_9BACT|nr:PH domain-containing protein [Rhodopirellula maiorica]EMI17459.1 membrane-flanked domain-containing protein [Rhodopirellula maiorica SM1]
MHSDPDPSDNATLPAFDATTITRPDDSLLVYYFIISMLTTIGFPIVFVPLFIRFKTLQYRFDEQGVSMCWGYFFRREVYLTYARLQDIHVTRNIIERWMGLAKLPIQTASGASGATMKIEGIRNPEPLRDFLYLRMRDVNDEIESDADLESESTELLREIRDELRKQRSQREAKR